MTIDHILKSFSNQRKTATAVAVPNSKMTGNLSTGEDFRTKFNSEDTHNPESKHPHRK